MRLLKFNQLLFHQNQKSASIYLSSINDPMNKISDSFFYELKNQIQMEDENLNRLFKSIEPNIHQLRLTHPHQSLAVFISENLTGYLFINSHCDSQYSFSDSFFLRPLLEDIFTDPQFGLINLGEGELKLYLGDFKQLDLLEIFSLNSFEQREHIPKLSLNQDGFNYRQLVQLKSLSQLLAQKSNLMNIPFVVTGEQQLREKFFELLKYNHGSILYSKDLTSMTCREILDQSFNFKKLVIDYYGDEFKTNLMKLIKANRIITKLDKIIEYAKSHHIQKLYIPNQTQVFGSINWEKCSYLINEKNKNGQYDILNEVAKKVITQHGKVISLSSHLFPEGSHCIAVIKQGNPWNSIAI